LSRPPPASLAIALWGALGVKDQGSSSVSIAARRRRGREHATRWPERFGAASQPRPSGPLIWLHGASVGEALAAEPLIERLRAVKDEEELAALKRACEITDRMFERLVEENFVGRAEHDVAWTIAQLFHEEGADDVAFESIVASGPNSARPHARATSREIRAGETVVIDTGCTVDGYSSDYTRTFVTGPVDGVVKEAYAVVLAAQQAALDGIRSGIAGVDADAVARRVVDETAFAGTFGHGLGHGLGLEVHEAPRMSTESTDTLMTGNVVTVEPGIYLPGRGGVRIEDLVVVTDEGADVLSAFTKELVTLN